MRGIATAFARLALAAIFIYAGAVKAGASEQFLIALMPFTFLPEGTIGWVASVLPWMEIGFGVWLLVPRGWKYGAAGIGVLSLVFAGVLLWALSLGIIVSCGCFGADETPSAGKMLLAAGRDILLAGVAWWLVLHRGGAPAKK